jgi:hypothetical protein
VSGRPAVISIATVNAWNRLNASTRQVAGGVDQLSAASAPDDRNLGEKVLAGGGGVG